MKCSRNHQIFPSCLAQATQRDREQAPYLNLTILYEISPGWPGRLKATGPSQRGFVGVCFQPCWLIEPSTQAVRPAFLLSWSILTSRCTDFHTLCLCHSKTWAKPSPIYFLTILKQHWERLLEQVSVSTFHRWGLWDSVKCLTYDNASHSGWIRL